MRAYSEPFHNGGPVEPERVDAIAKLKVFRSELGELISMAEAGEPLEEKLSSLRRAKDKALAWSTSPVGLSLATVPLTSAATILGVGVSTS